MRHLVATMSSELSLNVLLLMSSDLSPDVLDDAFLYLNERPSLDVGFILSLLFMTGTCTFFTNVAGNIFATITALSREEVGTPRLIFRQNFYGLPIFIFHRLAKFVILSRFPVKGSSLLSCFLLNIMAELLLSTLKVANVHIIVSKLDHSRTQISSSFRCIFSLSIWLTMFPAALLYSICSSTCFYLPLYVGRSMFNQIGQDGRDSHDWQLGMIAVLVAVLYFGLVVPSYAVFIRVAGSTLPLQRDSIFTIDKNIGLYGAWQSFSWPSRVAFFKLHTNVLILETGLGLTISIFVFALCHPALYIDVAQFFAKYAG